MPENNFCSPGAKIKSGTCYSKKSLLTLIESYNKAKPLNKILVRKNATIKALWNALNNKLKPFVKDGNEWCWTDYINKITTDFNLKNNIKKIEKTELKPAQPVSWIKNPTEWLSNYDIIAVMKQYEDVKNNHYKFLGVFPIDFTEKTLAGSCAYESHCNINIANFIKNKIKFIGFIINLDKHDEPGSHWTSIFMVIDPNYISYGAYYCDSVGTEIPENIKLYFKNIKKQLNSIYKLNKFKLIYSKTKNQRSNTECGMFSQMFQINWLKNLKKNKDSTIYNILNDKHNNDNDMKKLRNSLYRPNIKSIIK